MDAKTRSEFEKWFKEVEPNVSPKTTESICAQWGIEHERAKSKILKDTAIKVYNAAVDAELNLSEQQVVRMPNREFRNLVSLGAAISSLIDAVRTYESEGT